MGSHSALAGRRGRWGTCLQSVALPWACAGDEASADRAGACKAAVRAVAARLPACQMHPTPMAMPAVQAFAPN